MRLLTLPAALALSLGCSADSGFTAAADVSGTSTGAPAPQDGGSETEPPPEIEVDFYALAPAQTDVYVFVANPGRGTVTRVNAASLEVITVPVGSNPSSVLTTPDYRTAAVFNEGDDTVSLIDADTLDVLTVSVRPDLNRMVMSPDGSWVALWHDVTLQDPDDPLDGLVAFNEVSFVEVRTGRHEPLAVGNYPHGIEWTPDGSLALVVSDEQLALVDLTVEQLSRELIALSDDLVDPPAAEEVVLAPDGSYAFVRQFGAQDLAVVDLAARSVERVAAGDNPTDLDLTADGTRAVLVARDANQLWTYDVADPYAPADVLDLPDTMVSGSVTLDPSGRYGILYSNAVMQAVYAVWDVETGEVTPRSLVKPVQSVSISATGTGLLVFHTQDNQPELDPDDLFYDASAMTMVDLADFGKTDIWLPSTLKGYALSDNGAFGYFVLEGEPVLGVLDWGRLMVDEVTLSSDPVFIGAMPDLDPSDDDEPPAWVSQEHELGRMSFYDPDSGVISTLTGFELNSEIEVE